MAEAWVALDGSLAPQPQRPPVQLLTFDTLYQ